MLAVCVAMTMARNAPSVPWGLEALTALKTEFSIAGVPGYCEATLDGKPNGRLFNWGVGVLLSALNAAARHDEGWKKELRRFVDATDAYWNPAAPVAGYDVLPGPKQPDRYYDDNAWMVIALVESSEVLDDPALLKRARESLAFVLSGEDPKLDGGVYWRESDKLSKNTCSNAPTVAACLALYEKTQEPSLLESAERIYAWTKIKLQDPSDKLYWDAVGLDGKIDKTKWSYNSALMVRSGAELAGLTKKSSYLHDAQETARASEAKWLVNGRFADVGRFAHLLVESWNYVPDERRREQARAALRWLYESGKNGRGLYGGRFDAPPKQDQSVFELIDQASAARAFFIAP